MFANEIFIFCTITITTITTITTIITYTTFTFIKNYIHSFDKVKSCDKMIQTDINHMVDKMIQTDINHMVDKMIQTDINHMVDKMIQTDNIYNEFEYIENPIVENTLENLILLTKNLDNIENNPSNYNWTFC